jgi:hypothetical protein
MTEKLRLKLVGRNIFDRNESGLAWFQSEFGK